MHSVRDHPNSPPLLESGLREFGDRFPHPFTDNDEGVIKPEETIPYRDQPRTLVELRMCALSATLREKPRWYVKALDATIRRKWREEIVAQQEGVPRNLALTSNMVRERFPNEFFFWLLRCKLVDQLCLGRVGCIRVVEGPRDGDRGSCFYRVKGDDVVAMTLRWQAGPYDRIWRSDESIPEHLRKELLDAIVPLENVPDDQKDWHPRSNGQVLDLVHPSLYPVVYGTTSTVSGDVVSGPTPELASQGEEFCSDKFQWLPSDFAFKEDKKTVELVSPYVNNVHPSDHRKLHEVIPKLLESAVPMFDRVLSDLRREHELPFRVGDRDGAACIWPDEVSGPRRSTVSPSSLIGLV